MHKKKASFDLLSTYEGYVPSWKGMFALLGLLLAGSCIGSLIQFLLMLLPIKLELYHMMIITYPIMFIPAMLYCSARSRRELIMEEEGERAAIDCYKVKRGQINIIMLAFMCVVATVCSAIVTEPATKLLPPMPDILKAALEGITNAPIWAALLTTAVFAPFFEEWLCRGMVMRGLLKHSSPVVAILVSALFFAVIHMNPWQAIPAFVLGCLFGLVYYKTGSLKLCMLMHCANNAFSVLISHIPGAENAEYFSDLMTDPMHYRMLYLCALALCLLFVTRLLKLASEDTRCATE